MCICPFESVACVGILPRVGLIEGIWWIVELDLGYVDVSVDAALASL